MEKKYYNIPGMPSDIVNSTSGIYFEMIFDPNKEHSDNDGLTDKEETNKTMDGKLLLKSNPLRDDTDDDVINDYYDPDPWTYNDGDL